MKQREVYCIAHHLRSPLGDGALSNYTAVKAGSSGIRLIDDPNFYPTPTLCSKFEAGWENKITLANSEGLTALEKLCCLSIAEALRQTPGLDLERTQLFFSTTKGNIELLNGVDEIPNAVYLDQMGKSISDYFGLRHPCIVVSNACISGVSALLTAKRWIELEEIDHAIVCGTDLAGKFIVSGFHSFMAISNRPSKPYDKTRDGISLGEACATMVLSKDKSENSILGRVVKIAGGASSNDANHISGPSRTGQGLALAISKAMKNAKVKADQLSMISAHGTATPYNDEMESLAFDKLGLGHIPLNSIKGFFGHTLGAAGILESIMGLHQVCDKQALPTRGLDEKGVSKNLNVSGEPMVLATDKYLLKSISGFGGTNAAIIFEIEEK
jgi:3-oxoacyl-[acyl-carrier-protein] synthase-1